MNPRYGHQYQGGPPPQYPDPGVLPGVPPSAAGYPGAAPPPPFAAPPPKPPGFDVEAAQAADAAAGFADAAVRRGFMRKVLLIVLMQLVVTAGISLIFYYVQPLKLYVRINRWPFYLSWFLSFGMIIAMACSERLRKQYPINYVFLAAFTIVFSFQIGVITSYWDTQAVLTALVATAGVVGVCCILAFLTPLDFTKLRGFLVIFSIIFMFAVFFALIIGFMWVHNTTIVIISAVAAVLFSLYLIYDLQIIMGGKTYQLSPDEYVAASLSIYLDVVNIFLALLTIIGLTQN
ncbi:hypothetical protein WJX81_005493 [Elliptochloris bilobata]|uniref:Uncharacterized protein n=1 Tax=Elliptochloris bilobata TaxID=381761 RepID=A0AAW1SJP5_9CHLO